jgi:hypothetical protein
MVRWVIVGGYTGYAVLNLQSRIVGCTVYNVLLRVLPSISFE